MWNILRTIRRVAFMIGLLIATAMGVAVVVSDYLPDPEMVALLAAFGAAAAFTKGSEIERVADGATD